MLPKCDCVRESLCEKTAKRQVLLKVTVCEKAAKSESCQKRPRARRLQKDESCDKRSCARSLRRGAQGRCGKAKAATGDHVREACEGVCKKPAKGYARRLRKGEFCHKRSCVCVFLYFLTRCPRGQQRFSKESPSRPQLTGSQTGAPFSPSPPPNRPA